MRIWRVLSGCFFSLLIFSPGIVSAVRSDELKSIYGDSSYYDANSNNCSLVGTPLSTGISAGAKIYMLGDSISNQSLTELNAAFSAAQLTTTKINADSGRAISTDTAPPGTSGIQAITDDRTDILTADAVIVQLGTNSGTEDLNVQIPALVAKIREVKSGVAIYWVNLFYTASGGATARNTTIANNAQALSISLIDIANAGIQLGSDGTHPTAAGNQTFAQAVVSGVLSSSTDPSGDVSTVSSDGNPAHGLTYPGIADEAAAAKAIDDYIQEGWPTSPFVGLGRYFISGAKRSNVNPFLAAGHLQQENGFATASKGWHALSPPTYNAFGATSSTPPNTKYGNYSVLIWPSWIGSLDSTASGGRDDWFMNIRRLYLNTNGTYYSPDIQTYMSHYAPNSSAGNDESLYIQHIYATEDAITKGLTITGGIRSPSSACLSSIANGNVSVNGYAFPLEPQNQTVGGIRTGQTTTMHHDKTAAFDLFSPVESAKVYAIYGGVPVTIRTSFGGIPGCSSIQFRADDGFYYWYGHLKNVTAIEGVHVASGTQIAQIADRRSFNSNCWGGAPHLHIDRGCVINGVPQRGGSDPCRDPAFIPFLSALYATLPPR